MDICNQCGLCVEVCPVERGGASSFLARLAGGPAPDEAIWYCTSCWLCQATCPLNLDIHDLIVAARRESAALPAYIGGYENVRRTGFTLPLPPDLNAVRAGYGLPPVKLPDRETLRLLLGAPPGDVNR